MQVRVKALAKRGEKNQPTTTLVLLSLRYPVAQYIYWNSKLFTLIFYFAEPVRTNLLADSVEQHAQYT